LADEINRTPPKTQAALLEAMQEHKVTARGITYPLEPPFFVLATQNPIEQEGTYPLPEAQLDRFLLKIIINYPTRDDEYKIVDLYTGEKFPDTEKIISRDDLLAIQELIRKMPISNDNKNYAIDIITKTRPENSKIAKMYLDYGASPRASIGLVMASKARALINGRNYVTKEDINAMSFPVLRHRIILNFESERRGISTEEIIERIIKKK
ncbi:MAG: MoxR family ATPase, partial [Candidatus Altiarchaeales archaeon]|nr:MoxR family ATPase [Candidatus Altiarchaeales archaeon]